VVRPTTNRPEVSCSACPDRRATIRRHNRRRRQSKTSPTTSSTAGSSGTQTRTVNQIKTTREENSKRT